MLGKRAIITAATRLLFVANHPSHHGNLVFRQLVDVSLVALYVMTMATEPGLQMIHLPLKDVVPLLQVVHQLLIVGRDQSVELMMGLDFLLQSICLEKPSEKESPKGSQSLTAYPLSLVLVHCPQPHGHRGTVLIARVKAVIGRLYPSLLSRIPIRIRHMNCASLADRSLPPNNPSIIQSMAMASRHKESTTRYQNRSH